ncbi:MAG TPA: sensor histidine kinase [Thermoanaerobaculia bacterium]
MQTDRNTAEQMLALASYLEARREAIVQTWERMVLDDSVMEVAPTLSITHFRDLIPEVLKSFEDELKAGLGSADIEKKQHKDDIGHGLHRWQQSYTLHEVVREWGHLQICVIDELDNYGLTHPDVPRDLMAVVRRAWIQRCTQGVNESVAQYSRVQEVEATGRLRDLQGALEHLRQVERQRAESWREAVHDLRGNVGLVTSSSFLLNEDGVPDTLRSKAVNVLQSSVDSLRHMLEDLLSLARLEAGHEQRQVEAFDASALLRGMCEALQPLAHEKGLFLECDGPASLPVEGDSIKVRRVIQNLALNALKYTREGGVTVAWGETQESDAERWLVRVQDTGPGLYIAPGGPLVIEVKKATDAAFELEENVRKHGPATAQVEPVPPAVSQGEQRPLDQQPGEGIGLSIVKRLCDLLEASLEVTSPPEGGTLFQVVLPRRYPYGG